MKIMSELFAYLPMSNREKSEQNENGSPSLLSSSPSPQSCNVVPTSIDSIPSKKVDDPKEGESINDSTPPRDTSTPSSCASKPHHSFPNRLKEKNG